MEIQLYINEEQIGPYTLAQVQEMLAAGEITSEDAAWIEEWGEEWGTVGQLPGIDDAGNVEEPAEEAEEEPAEEAEEEPAEEAEEEAAVLFVWPEGSEDWAGPYTLAQVQELLASGEIAGTDFAAGAEGMEEGATVADIPGVQAEEAGEPAAEEEEEEPAAEEEEEEEPEEAPVAVKKKGGLKPKTIKKSIGLGGKRGGPISRAWKNAGMMEEGEEEEGEEEEAEAPAKKGLAKKGGIAKKGATGFAAKKGALGKGTTKAAEKKTAAPQKQVIESGAISDKSFSAVFIVAVFLGPLGIHRFMTGKILTGVLMLCTGGGVLIWSLIDVLMIALSKFKDKQGLVVAMPPQEGMSEKSFGTTILLFCFLSLLAMHRFTTGKILFALLYLFTIGGLGIWAIIDFFMLATGNFKDKEGRPILAVAK